VRNRVHGPDAQAAIDELYAKTKKTGGGGGSSGLVKTYYADNGATTITFTGAQQPIATIAGVVVGAGQKVIVHAAVWVNNSGDSAADSDIQVTENGAVVDETRGSTLGLADASVARIFELSPAPGTYTYVLQGAYVGLNSGPQVYGTAGSPNGTPGGRLTVEVVSV
jgi:hypothetical protein